MSTVPRDKARQCALLKAELLAAARAAVAKLTDEQCEGIYVEIEQRLAGALREDAAADLTREQPPSNAPPSENPQPAADLPFAEAKRRAAENVEREHLARLMARSDGTVTDAARLAGMDRSNFRKRLQRAGLREPGKKKPGPRYTDQILKILDEDRAGLRTHEIAKRTSGRTERLPNPEAPGAPGARGASRQAHEHALDPARHRARAAR